MSLLRMDAKWWLVSSKGATHMVIIIQVLEQPDALDLEIWKNEAKTQPIDPELASGDPTLRQYNSHQCPRGAHTT